MGVVYSQEHKQPTLNACKGGKRGHMKRIKAINGYTIYEITERDAKHDASKTAGEYEIYFSSDIRDYGLSNSYPEFDSIDSLNVAIELCSGNTAIAKEICENISTCVDFADVEKVAILNSTDFTITDNVIELTANTDENLIDEFLGLCAGYTSETYYNKCIITND